MEELKKAKTPVFDDVPAELLQAAGDAAVGVLHRLYVKIWQETEWSKDWTKAIFVRLPKRGKRWECANQGMIPLISHVRNVLLQVLLGRIRTVLDREIDFVRNLVTEEMEGQGTTCLTGAGSSKNVGTNSMTLHL